MPSTVHASLALGWSQSPPPPSSTAAPPMETSQQCSNGSFSCGWSRNVRLPGESSDGGLRSSHDAQDSDSFIEMDPRFISKRRKADSMDFEFDLPASPEPPLLVHADQIFSDGLLLPLHRVTPPKAETISVSPAADSALKRSLSAGSSESSLSRSDRFRFRHSQTAVTQPPSLNSSPLRSPMRGLPWSSRRTKQESPLLNAPAKSYRNFFFKHLKSFLTPFCKKVKGKVVITRASCSTSPSVVDASIHDAVIYCKNSLGERSETRPQVRKLCV